MEATVKLFFLLALTFTGILCGASLDQSIKQLPARHHIGVNAFSSYAKAADLKNGVIWYAILGIGSALSCIVTALLVWRQGEHNPIFPIYLGAFFAICHTVCTLFAAPTYFKQKTIHDEELLRRLFNRFEFISAMSSAFVTLNFLCFMSALIVIT